jgi:hypothetical protein
MIVGRKEKSNPHWESNLGRLATLLIQLICLNAVARLVNGSLYKMHQMNAQCGVTSVSTPSFSFEATVNFD